MGVEGAQITATNSIRGAYREGTALANWTDRHTTSAAEGAFVFTGLPYGSLLSVTVEKDGFRLPDSEAVMVRLRHGVPPTPVLLRLPETGKLDGVVVDPDGRPVPGAEVSLYASFDQKGTVVYWHAGARGSKPVRCDAQGRFTMQGLPAHLSHAFIAEGAGFGTGRAERVRLASLLEDVVITLPRACTLRGRVLDGVSNRPLAGALLKTSASICTGGHGNLVISSDSEGRFRFNALPSGILHLQILKPGSGAGQATLVAQYYIQLGDGEVLHDLELKVIPTLTARGRVVDRETSQGIEGVSVSISQGRQGHPKVIAYNVSNAQARTDTDGAFALPGLLPGLYNFSAYHKDYRSSSRIPASGLVTVKTDKDVQDLILPLERFPPGRLEGEILDESGNPLAGVHVVTDSGPRRPLSEDEEYHPDPSGLSDASGRFVLSGLFLHKRYRLLADPCGPWQGTTSESFELTKENPVAHIALRLQEGGMVSGRVTDAAGAPVSLVRIFTKRADPPEGSTRTFSLPRTLTDLEGRYDLLGLGAGDYSVSAWKEGYAIAGNSTRVHLEQRQLVTGADLVLKKEEERTFPLRGLLVDLNGRKLGGWKVHLRYESVSDVGHGVSAPDGSFLIQATRYGLGPNKTGADYWLELSGQEVTARTGRFAPSDEELVFVVPMGKGIRGRLVDETTREPVTRYSLVITRIFEPVPVALKGTQCVVDSFRSSRFDCAAHDENGRFEWSPAPLGTYDLVFGADSAPLKRIEKVSVGKDGADLGDIAVTRGVVLAARLVDAQTGEPLSSPNADDRRHSAYPQYLSGRSSGGKWLPLSLLRPIDSKGRIEIAGVTPDTKSIRMEILAFSDQTWPIQLELTALTIGADGKGDLGEIAVWLGEVDGQLVDAGTGRPYESEFSTGPHCRAVAAIASGESVPIPSPNINPGGRLEWNGVPADVRSVTLCVRDRLPVRMDFSFSGEKGIPNLGVVRLEKGEPLRGKVIGVDGKPASSAQVVVICLEQGHVAVPEELDGLPETGQHCVRATTDDRGEFKAAGLYPGPARVRIYAPASHWQDCTILAGQDNFIEIRCPAPGK